MPHVTMISFLAYSSNAFPRCKHRTPIARRLSQIKRSARVSKNSFNATQVFFSNWSFELKSLHTELAQLSRLEIGFRCCACRWRLSVHCKKSKAEFDRFPSFD